MRTSFVPFLTTALVAVTLTLSPAASRAADTQPGSQPSDVERRLRDVEESVRQLKTDARKVEIAEEEQAKQKPPAGWQDGFFIQSPDGEFKLKVGGYTHADERFFLGGADRPNVSQFVFRRARINLEGTVFKFFDFRILPDFASSKLVLQDAYLDARPVPEAKVRVGKFKTPFGLERLQSATSIAFIERALPTNLVPNRDLGLQVHGDLLRGAVSYAAGVFNGVPDGGTSTGTSTTTRISRRACSHIPSRTPRWSRSEGSAWVHPARTGINEAPSPPPTFRPSRPPGKRPSSSIERILPPPPQAPPSPPANATASHRKDTTTGTRSAYSASSCPPPNAFFAKARAQG